MRLIGTAILIGFFPSAFSQASLPYHVLSKQLAVKQISFRETPSALLSVFIANLPSSLDDGGLSPEGLDDQSCHRIPIGIGIPGFQPGVNKSDILRMFGAPTRTASGYWPNTRAVSYDLIPDQVSLGFLFDKNSERIRQTEASFTKEVDSGVMLVTVNSMLGCRLNEQIQRGLQEVWEGQSPQYTFNIGPLKGVVKQDKRNRVYVGIWESDLH